MVSWRQWFHLPLKKPFGSSLDGVGFREIGLHGLDKSNSNGATLGDVCCWHLYAYVNASVYNYQSRGWPATFVRRAAMIVPLYRSTWPLLCWGEILVKLFIIDIILHTSTKNFDVNHPHLSAMSSSRGPKLNTQELMKWPTTCAADILFIWKVWVKLLNRSVVNNRYSWGL